MTPLRKGNPMIPLILIAGAVLFIAYCEYTRRRDNEGSFDYNK